MRTQSGMTSSPANSELKAQVEMWVVKEARLRGCSVSWAAGAVPVRVGLTGVPGHTMCTQAARRASLRLHAGCSCVQSSTQAKQQHY